MRFFNILLKSNKKRVAHVLDNLMRNIPEIEIIPAIEGQTNELEFYLEDREIHPKYLKICRRGELACLLSHIRVWKKMISEDIPEAVILEDDASISFDFLEKFNITYDELPKDYNFLYLFVHPESQQLISSTIISDHLTLGYPTYGTVGYLITKKLAQELIELFSININLPIDETISWYLKENKKNYFATLNDLVSTSGDVHRKSSERTNLGSVIKETGLYHNSQNKISFSFYFDQGNYLCFPCCDVQGNYYYDSNHTLKTSKEKYLNNNHVVAFNSDGVLKNNLNDWFIAPEVSLYVKSNNLQKNNYRRKSILLTGGCGYIGCHCLLELLLNRHEDIVIIDNLSNSSNTNVNKIKDLGNVYIYNVDITNEEECDKIFRSHNITQVIHFAAHKAVKESIDNPLKYYSNNINGLLVLLKCMNKYDVKKIIFSSSATVYGMPDTLPIDENSKINTLNPYGRTKYFAEEILKDVSNAHNMQVICLRYFNPVGNYYLIPENSNVITNLFPTIISVIQGDKDYLSIYGNDYNTSRRDASINSDECNYNTSRRDASINSLELNDGTAIRDYIHVIDLARGHLAALEYMEREEVKFDVFNLGTGEGYSVLEVIQEFLKYEEVNCKFENRRPGDAPEVYANVSKANEILGWKTELTLENMVCDSLGL